MASVPLTHPFTQPLEVEVVTQVGTSTSPLIADLHGLDQQTFAEKEAEVEAIHPYMLMSNKLVTVNDFVLVGPDVGFVVGTSVDLLENQKVLQSITSLNELLTKGLQSLVAVSKRLFLP